MTERFKFIIFLPVRNHGRSGSGGDGTPSLSGTPLCILFCHHLRHYPAGSAGGLCCGRYRQERTHENRLYGCQAYYGGFYHTVFVCHGPHQASSTRDVFLQWLDTYVYGCKDHWDYCAKVGWHRLRKLTCLECQFNCIRA